MLINFTSILAALSVAGTVLAVPTPPGSSEQSLNATIAERYVEWARLCLRSGSYNACLGRDAQGTFRIYPPSDARTTWFQNQRLTNIVKDGNWEGFMTSWNEKGIPVMTIKDWVRGLVQEWEWIYSNDGKNSVIRGKGTNLCLDVKDGKMQEGTIVQTWDCGYGNPNQQWSWVWPVEYVPGR